MPAPILIVTGTNPDDRVLAGRVIAAENNWPFIDIEALTGTLAECLLGEATGDSGNRTSLTYKNVVLPAQVAAAGDAAWAQAEAGVPGAVIVSPQRPDTDWVNDLNEGFQGLGAEASFVHVLSDGEQRPALDPEHFVVRTPTTAEDLFAAATLIAVEVAQD
ncbi:hypothetical protein [Microbacterium sp. 77mftsu3.1]|uniref:hypothetical protein n=1 Tax=Microbacterium sp. 77mftsu3.1 TaxID=1761802 RepID=UPI000370268A|nr:hypothetical protein [Microbacterium sp. 77mftsu3.1]SDH39291.1 hypothetical protein SAMN04488590_3220 [Microbacterium sp. 77mftsu3.1]